MKLAEMVIGQGRFMFVDPECEKASKGPKRRKLIKPKYDRQLDKSSLPVNYTISKKGYGCKWT